MKEAEFSIVIPVFRERENINLCLEYLRLQLGISRAEVIVVDGAGDSTIRVIRRDCYPFRLVSLQAQQGRGQQLNRGAEAASGRFFIFLHVDTVLPKGALAQIRRTLEDYDAGAFSLGVANNNYLLKLWIFLVNIRARMYRNPFGDQAHFMRREVFERVGGFENIPIMEDVSMMERLKKGGFRVKVLNSRVLTSVRRWKGEGYLRNILRNMYVFWSYRRGISPWRLLEFYKPNYDKINNIN